MQRDLMQIRRCLAMTGFRVSTAGPGLAAGQQRERDIRTVGFMSDYLGILSAPFLRLA